MIPSLSTASQSRLLLATASRELELRIAEILSGERYSVQRVRNGTEALNAILDADPPEIALLDAELPLLKGLEIAAQVKHRPERKMTWVILLTGAADPDTVSNAADAGVDDLLLCPVSEADLNIRLGVAARVMEIRKQMEAQVEAEAHAARFHASHDHLTGLWNRESLLSLLFPETDRVQRMGTPLSLLLLDIDDFASVNAEHGYETGDKILQELAMRLRRYLRSYDLIGRCGEDEFLIALPGCTANQALQLAERIQTILLRRPFAAGFGPITLTASVGVAQSRGRSPLVVLREAERAMATAKLKGMSAGTRLEYQTES
jgi:diguanylate cyclase (GGDEF)-like protein